MNVYSIFQSIDGECNIRHQGSLTTFIRLAGCNLTCAYCDTPESRSGGTEMSVQQVAKTISELDCPNVTITGGEPLLQGEELKDLIFTFLIHSDRQWNFSIETNGTINPARFIKDLGVGTFFVMDFKLPSSGFFDYNNKNYLNLREEDWIKFVICDERDYHTAVDVVKNLFGYQNKAKLAFSPAFGQTNQNWAKKVAEWMIRDKLWHVNLNVQIHKLIDMP